ncbi:GNAT family N-acetyltransferase [Solihabitans fulvus]|uniref:GNAT family N-acetyltransferase n=1 Tax=Solihabitans fulvus TaxID=1892852 RepID=A0A5B2WQ03_9PSEU|nr:GNAT family N-acetyltransferase [Solihabitans fulvus]KAA2252860.1 GNAT family N-acetyltransferase [Solihabitans fulvus]
MTLARLDVEVFDPYTAPEADLVGYHRVMAAWWRTDKPDLPPLTYDDCVGRLKTPFPGFGEEVLWVARHQGEILGFATVDFLEQEGSHIALTEINVDPGVRRQGIGTTMLRALLPELRVRDRDVVEGWQLTVGGDGPKWAESRGFRTVHTVLMQTLEFSEADPTLWDVVVPPGYRTRRWIGAAPEELVASYAEARQAIHDAPLGELEYQEPDWTVARVREHETELRAAGTEQRVVVVVHESTGTVAGLTELGVHPNDLTWGYQRDTAVLTAYRGHGLGRCIKAEMIRWLLGQN